MNITCEKNKLLKILSISMNSVSERTTVEALKCFKLETKNNLLIITTNNLKTNIICSLDAQVDSEGVTLVHAKTFYNIISKLPSEDVSMYLSENNTLLISSGDSTFNIFTANPEEFPENMLIDEYKEISLSKEVFKDMVRRVAFAASEEEEKVILNGVLIDIDSEKKKIIFVAADGYRLAKDDISFNGKDSLKVIIPIKTIKEIMSIFSIKETETIKIRLGEDKILFMIEEVQMYSRVINGQFPDYNLLIPKEKNLDIKINRKEFLDACERINIIAQRNSYMVKVELVNKALVISSVTPDFGDGSEKLSIEYSGDDNINVVFNVRLMMDVLKSLESDYIKIEIINDEKPLVIKEDNNQEYIYIMMPIKVKR
ncbi:MAG: DNA polymerase III subunit beta [Candidatus Margulisbacteria bacterium]|nr:DNA polymerase III subunit beta [Candidatus Margulisiibacteriota bacterium]